MSCDDNQNAGKTLRIHFLAFKPTGFQENKISFHKTGYIHSTDNHGKRYRDGVIGIPFQNVESFLFILVVAPKNPVEMIETNSIDIKRDIQIHLKDDVGPFAAQFAIARKSTDILPQIPPAENLLGGCIKCEYEDKPFALILAFTKVLKTLELEEISWPPFPLVLKRIG